MKMQNQFWFLEHDIYKDDDWQEKELYYDPDKKKWVKREEYTGNWWPATFSCCSYKAAIRHLKKHNEIPKGTRFRLVSKFVGFDRWLTKK